MAGVPGLMTPNVDQHAAFHGGLEAFLAYLDAVQAGKDKYDGEKLRGIIDSFMPVLRAQLVDEIQTLLALERYEDKGDWAAWMEKVRDGILKQMQADPDLKVRRPRVLVVVGDLVLYCTRPVPGPKPLLTTAVVILVHERAGVAREPRSNIRQGRTELASHAVDRKVVDDMGLFPEA